jgi:hypothetical protein
MLREFNGLQKKMVEYLKIKYPRNMKNFVADDLMRNFKDFDSTLEPEFDIIRNAQCKFNS